MEITKESPLKDMQDVLNLAGLRKLCKDNIKLLEPGELPRCLVEGVTIYPPEFYIQVSTDTRDYADCVEGLLIEELKLISKFEDFGLENYTLYLTLRPDGGKIDGATFSLIPIDGAIGGTNIQGYFISELVSLVMIPKSNPEKIFKACTGVSSDIVEQKINLGSQKES